MGCLESLTLIYKDNTLNRATSRESEIHKLDVNCGAWEVPILCNVSREKTRFLQQLFLNHFNRLNFILNN